MKNILFGSLLLVTIFGSAGCLKNNNGPCTNKTPASELATMQAYASSIGMTATVHSSGLLYQIVTQGSGATPTASSKVYVRYSGKLISNGTLFDQQSDPSRTGFVLAGLIPGWQIGIPLIQKGGYIKLIIPSSLAYGCQGSGIIPADAVLYFEIELVDVQ